MNRPKLKSIYSNIFENFSSLKDTGLIPPERCLEIASYLTEDQFEPAILKSGRAIPGWWAHKITGDIFNEYFMTGGKWSRNEAILNYVLTAEEIEKLNKHGNDAWSRANDKARFDRATKIKAADWDGPVYAGDDYFESVDDYLDSLECDDLECPEYIWGVDEITPTLELSATDIVERAIEDKGVDDAAIDFDGFAEFEKVVDKFVDLNASRKSWYSTEKVAVLLK